MTIKELSTQLHNLAKDHIINGEARCRDCIEIEDEEEWEDE